jgi:hypothetical protein
LGFFPVLTLIQLDLIATQWGIDIAKTEEEGSQSQPEPGPSGGRGGHAEVEAQSGATSQGLATSRKKKDIMNIVIRRESCIHTCD